MPLPRAWEGDTMPLHLAMVGAQGGLSPGEMLPGQMLWMWCGACAGTGMCTGLGMEMTGDAPGKDVQPWLAALRATVPAAAPVARLDLILATVVYIHH